MKILSQLLLLVLLTVTGCKTGVDSVHIEETRTDRSLTLATEEPTTTEDPNWFEATVGGYTVGMSYPSSWEAHDTSGKAVFTERTYTLDDTMTPDGLSVSVFLPTESDLNHAADAPDPCMALMEYVTSSPGHVGQSAVIEPHAFQWNDHNAAYYTLDDHQGMVALVIAVCIGNGDIMVFNISGPEDHGQRLRDELPKIMETIQIDGTHFNGTELDSLPNPLPFPAIPNDE